MVGKKFPKYSVSEMMVKNGDESHGIESVTKSPTKQIQEKQVDFHRLI